MDSSPKADRIIMHHYEFTVLFKKEAKKAVSTTTLAGQKRAHAYAHPLHSASENLNRSVFCEFGLSQVDDCLSTLCRLLAGSLARLVTSGKAIQRELHL